MAHVLGVLSEPAARFRWGVCGELPLLKASASVPGSRSLATAVPPRRQLSRAGLLLALVRLDVGFVGVLGRIGPLLTTHWVDSGCACRAATGSRAVVARRWAGSAALMGSMVSEFGGSPSHLLGHYGLARLSLSGL